MSGLTRPRVIGAALVALLLGLAGFVSIFAGPGYEMALLAGFVCPPAAAVVTSRELTERPRSGFSMLGRAVENGCLLFALAYGVALLHGWRAGMCDLVSGTLFMVLGPGAGAILGGVWGAVASELARRLARPGARRTATSIALALAGPVGSAGVQLVLFYATPMVFAYDPFVGYFSGALYDTVLSTDNLLSYRAGSAATLIACYVVSLHLARDEDQRLRWRPLGRPGLMAVGSLAALGALVSAASGQRLGHWHTAASIAAELGGEHTVGRCRVLYDRRLDPDHVSLFARDCDAHIDSIERWLGASDLEPVTAYLFFDVEQKRRLMGAAHTSVAKPWRREIYLHSSPYPHRVVGHELAHVLAARFARGPFDIAGDLGGWLPNPGLIEGIAVAASPREDDLSGDEWAAAMRRIDVLPRLEDLFALGFFGNASSTSYTAAGSFVSFVRRTHGPEVVARWYGGTDLEELTGQSWSALEQSWWQALDAIELDAAALHMAKVRFDRPSVLGRRCPHVVDERLAQAGLLVGTGNVQGALAAYRQVLSLDPGNAHALFGVARCYDRMRDALEAEAALSGIARSDVVPLATQRTATERLGDMALRAGDASLATRRYREAREAVVDEDRLRTLDVKEHYAGDPVARAAVVALLIGSDEDGPVQAEALDRIGAWRAAHPEDGVPDYLFARQHIEAEAWQLAADRLDAALGKEIALPRVRVEALRLRIVAACALGDAKGARDALARYRREPGLSEGARERAEALVARCAG